MLDFVSAHADLILVVLKDSTVMTDRPLVLEESHLVTEMFYHLMATPQGSLLAMQKLQNNAIRFHHMLVNLLVVFTTREMALKNEQLSVIEVRMSLDK